MVTSDIPGSVSKKFPVGKFSTRPAVFAGVRYTGDPLNAGDQVSPFAVTVSEVDEDHVTFTFVCLATVEYPVGLVKGSSQAEAQSQTLASAPGIRDKYSCLWSSDWSLDWRAWASDPSSSYEVPKDTPSPSPAPARTPSPTSAPETPSPTPRPSKDDFLEPPFHRVTALSTTSTNSPTLNAEIAFPPETFDVSVPPGMIGMVYLDSAPKPEDTLQVYGLSLGINSVVTTASFYADLKSCDGEDLKPSLSLAWFAWNGTGTNCPKTNGQICAGHGVCPDSSSDDAVQACQCAGHYNGTGCDSCDVDYATKDCTVCDGFIEKTGQVCSGHGTCFDGIDNNGTCVCDPGGYLTLEFDNNGDQACGYCAPGW